MGGPRDSKYAAGDTFTTKSGNVLTAIRQIGRRNNHLVWVFHCNVCSQDEELWPDGSITSKMLHVQQGKAPCGCSNSPRWKQWQAEIRIKRAISGEHFEFLRWVDGYKNNKSKAVLFCPLHGECIADCHSITGKARSRCAECGNQRRINPDNEQKVISVCEAEGYKYLGCEDKVPLASSFYHIMCEKHGIWRATVSSLLCGNNRCPGCSPGGFKPQKRGVVYFIESTDGKYIKIGISNQPKKRLIKLRRDTPFEIKMTALFRMDGYLAKRLEHELLSCTESAGLAGFDGCTEWRMRNKAVKSWLVKMAMTMKAGQMPLLYGK